MTRRRLELTFFAVVLLMAGHQAEHVAQMVEKNALGNPCPAECRGALGFIFDVEWVHVAYNHSLLVLLAALYVAFAMWRREWRRANPLAWALITVGVFLIQGYHVIEHTVKLDQWLANGHRSPTPGLLGQLLPGPLDRNFSLIELHFTFNTVVFSAVIAAYFLYGFHRRVPHVPAAAPAVAIGALLVAPVGIAWATRTPTVELGPGVHRGPIVVDRTQKLVAAPGAVVRGGVRITADNVIVRGVRVVGGRYGIEVVGARNVLLDDVHVRGAVLDGIHARRASLRIRNCRVDSLRSRYAQGIDVSFGFDLAPTVIEDCTVVGGQEGIVANSVRADVRRNHVVRSTLRGITINEMAMATVERNVVERAIGVGILCIDYSICRIRNNAVLWTRRDRRSDNAARAGYAIQASFGAKAQIRDNRLIANDRGLGAFADARFEHD